ncbi:hypothetical protein C8Q75DRAFT_730436 [Abortiporus biennis]|nr:hypothetical protein C8Q75DRAFT_730436 [Abortiporus biennis]
MSLGPDGVAMIRGMHAPLKMLTLSFDPDADIDKNPLVYLENFSSTLESFEISFGRFLDEPTSLRCDSLRRMRVFDCDIPDSSVIVQAFPKLSEFSFFDGSMDPEPNRGIRIENVERLDELERKWQALGSVHGEINSLYEFGLSCEVRRMDLHSCAVGRINSCRELLVKTRPSKLAIGMDNPQAIFAAERDIFGYGGLTELHVSLVFTREFVPSASPHELFENLINSLKHATSLSHLRITISSGMQMCHICQHKNLGLHTCAQAEESNELMASSHHYPPSPVGEWLLKLDTQDFVQRLIKAVSTLESFVLDMGMGIPPSIHGWKISRDASPQLVEVLTKKQCMELVEKVRECDCHYYY